MTDFMISGIFILVVSILFLLPCYLITIINGWYPAFLPNISQLGKFSPASEILSLGFAVIGFLVYTYNTNILKMLQAEPLKYSKRSILVYEWSNMISLVTFFLVSSFRVSKRSVLQRWIFPNLHLVGIH